MTQDDKNVLAQAAATITRLRRENELMAARLEVFDSMILIFSTNPPMQTNCSEIDFVDRINDLIREDNDNEKAPGKDTEDGYPFRQPRCGRP